MLQITARRSRRSHSISRDRPTSSIARQTVDRRAAVSKHERRSRTGVFRRRPGPGGGSARPTCAATEPAGLRDRNRPPCACNGALHAAQPSRSADANPQSRFGIGHRSAVPRRQRSGTRRTLLLSTCGSATMTAATSLELAVSRTRALFLLGVEAAAASPCWMRPKRLTSRFSSKTGADVYLIMASIPAPTMALRRSAATRLRESNAKRASRRSPCAYSCWRHHPRGHASEQGQNVAHAATAQSIPCRDR
jgi:hypothetical protein